MLENVGQGDSLQQTSTRLLPSNVAFGIIKLKNGALKLPDEQFSA